MLNGRCHLLSQRKSRWAWPELQEELQLHKQLARWSLQIAAEGLCNVAANVLETLFILFSVHSAGITGIVTSSIICTRR